MMNKQSSNEITWSHGLPQRTAPNVASKITAGLDSTSCAWSGRDFEGKKKSRGQCGRHGFIDPAIAGTVGNGNEAFLTDCRNRLPLYLPYRIHYSSRNCARIRHLQDNKPF